MASINNKIKDQQEVSLDELRTKLTRERIIEERNNRIYLTRIGKLALGEDEPGMSNRKDIINPYIQARQEWDERMGYSVARESVWRRIACLCLIIMIVETIGFIYIATRSHIEPYLIAQDKIGTITPLGVPHKLRVDQSAAETQMMVYVTALRSFSIDKAVNDHNIDIMTAMTAGNALAKAGTYMKAQSPDPQPTTVQVTNVQPIPNSDSFQIDWTETTDSVEATNKTYWRAWITTKLTTTPDDKVKIPNNPFGIIITEIKVTSRVS